MNCSKYYICDLVGDVENLRVIFVLESPHSDEIIHRHPIAGSSGLSMSRFLQSLYDVIDPLVPLGCQISKKNISNIGIINCSKFPLDKNVYGCNDISGEFPIDSFDIIRNNPKSKKRKNSNTGRAHKHLLKKFITRVKKVVSLNSTVLFVPCGELARNFLEECHLAPKNAYLKKVPHPSRNQWYDTEYFDDFNHFIELIGSKLNQS